MADERNYDVWPRVRDKPYILTRHAEHACAAERPPIRAHLIEAVLEGPNHDDGTTAWKRIGRRTIIIRYRESPAAIYVVTVSATRARLRA